MGMQLLRWIEEQLAANQYEYLGIELQVMSDYQPEYQDLVLKDHTRYQSLILKEKELLKLYEETMKGGPVEYSEPPCRINGAQWELRKKYRGKTDGAKQPTKVRIARRRQLTRKQNEVTMFN